MRTALAVAFGIVIGGATVVVGVEEWRPSWFVSDSVGSVHPTADSSAGAPPPAAPAPLQSRESSTPVGDRTVSRPTTPAYDRRPEDSHAIYRCRAAGRTTYSNLPCTNGTVIDDSNAVTGFDSRPSAAMERMIVEGRKPSVDAKPASRVTVADAAPPPARSDLCALMNRQIFDIDYQMRLPNASRTLDYWRQVRQDIRTSMIRERC